jgi:integrase
MGFIEKRNGRYRARYRDPLGRQRCETFTRKADAQRFQREMQVDIERGHWIDPRGADTPLASWAGEFLALARRLSPTTQETYRRDLDKYLLPRFGSHRLGRLPADEIENWLNDEIAAGIAPSSVYRHYRVLQRMLQVAVEKQRISANPCDRVSPLHIPKRDMVLLSWEQAVDLAEALGERYREPIYLAVDSGMRWRELVGLRRASLDVWARKVRVTEQLVRLRPGEWLRKEPKTSSSVRSITISPVTAAVLEEHLERFARPGPEGIVFPNSAGRPIIASSFWNNHFTPALSHAGVSHSQLAAHERCPGDRRGRAPEGHPGADGAFVDQCHPRSIRSLVPGARRGHRNLIRGTPGGSPWAQVIDRRPRHLRQRYRRLAGPGNHGLGRRRVGVQRGPRPEIT